MKKLLWITMIVMLILTLALVSCNDNQKSITIKTGKSDSPKSKVAEVIQTSNYTYLRVEKGNQEEWIAINKQDVNVGSIIYYEQGLKMENFTSPELQRTFETIYFVQEISDTPREKKMPEGMMGDQPMKPVLSKLEDLKINQPDGGVTIRELYANRKSYSGNSVKIKGKVTKVNLAIMSRNWIHIQDGTADGDNFDLTITTSHEPAIGDTVTYTGTLVLNKDFGSGYSYELIMEDAVALEPY